MSRTLMRYHARIGTTYMPNLKARVPNRDGGYLVRTNAAGFRSEREFVAEKAPGTFRILLFGDSQTAGDGVPNAQRFGDRLEQRLAGVEVCNYAIGGTGPDQHLLAYEEAAAVEHDLLVIAVFAENIRRVSRQIIASRDERGERVFYSKPYYVPDGDGLTLRNVPVPRDIWTDATLPPERLGDVYRFSDANLLSHLSGRSVALPQTPRFVEPIRRTARRVALRLSAYRPLPEYDDPANESWLLLRAILSRWIAASRVPVLLVPLPHPAMVRTGSDVSGYTARFRELAAATQCHLHNPLPAILELPEAGRAALWSDWSGHLTAAGHALLAASLEDAVRPLTQVKRPLLASAGT